MSIFSTETQTSGRFNDAPATIKSVRAVKYDFVTKEGVNKGSAPAVQYILITEDGREIKDIWGLGRAMSERVKATPDGKTFVALPGQTMPAGFNKATAIAMVMAAIAEHAPELAEAIDQGNGGKGDLTLLDGHKFHFRIQSRKYEAQDGTTKTDDVLLPTQYLGKGKGAKSAPAKTSKSKAKADEDEDEEEDTDFDVDAELTTLIKKVLKSQDEGITKIQLQGLMVPELAKAAKKNSAWEPHRRDALAKISDVSWLKEQAEAGEWDYTGKQITAAEDDDEDDE
jgi:hypothetical protein